MRYLLLSYLLLGGFCTSCSLFEGDDIVLMDSYTGTYRAYHFINDEVFDKIDFTINTVLLSDTTEMIENASLRIRLRDDDTYQFLSSTNQVATFINRHTREFEDNISGQEKTLAFDCDDQFTVTCEGDVADGDNILRVVEVESNVLELLVWTIDVRGDEVLFRFERNTDPNGVLGSNDRFVFEFTGRRVIQ